MGASSALVLHGLTGTPQSVAVVSAALEGAGFVVRSPLLAGHGTSLDDLERYGWPDWVVCAESALASSAGQPAVVVGLSMGGSLACWLAAVHAADVAGLVLINPFIDPPAESFREALRALMADGFPRAPAIRGDIADPGAVEVGYDELPLAPMLSLSAGLDDLLARLPSIACPTLLMTSRVDHVVPTVSSDMLAERVSGPVERVWLERSYHVATLDYDKEEVGRRAVDFAMKAVGGP